MTVFDILAEPVQAHLHLDKAALNQRVRDYVEMVGLSTKALDKYPHEFSGEKGNESRLHAP